MKEETPNYQQQESSIVYNGHSLCLDTSLPDSDPPGPRFKHQSFLYKGRLYVHGGTTIPSSEFSDDPLDIFCYHFEGEDAGRWKRIKTRVSNNKELETASAHAGVVSGNKWYVFGGSNSDCRPNSQLLRLNLDTYEWTRMQQKGEVPSPRESAFLTFFEKCWLLLYGGISTTEVEIYNTFHFYNLDTRNWSTCQGSYQYQVYARLDPALAHFNDRLYLFGGTYRSISNEQRYLNDFYEITVSPPGRNLAGRVQMKRLSSPQVPQGRSGHSLIGLDSHHLALIGGENSNSQMRDGLRFDDVTLVDNIWIFDTRCATWNRLQLGRSFRYRSMATCVNLSDKLYLFGGLHSYNTVLKDFVQITVNPNELALPKTTVFTCIKCHERELFPVSSRHFSAEVIDDITQSIDFPFAAFGLLIDNSMNSGASLLKISYFHAFGQQKLRLFKFQDDAKLNWTDQELLDTLGNFNAGQMYLPSGMDKKIKAGMMRENFRRQYGYNLKIGSLRLGEGFLFITYFDDQALFRVFYLEKEGKNTPLQRYELYYYTYNTLERRVGSPEMDSARQRIMSKYGDIIEGVFFQKKCRNTLFIFNPRIQQSREVLQEEAELKADIVNSNILYGSIQSVREIERIGRFVHECVDVSLRAYITCLYLKNQCMKIMLSVKEASYNPIEVQTQTFLEKVDRLCKHKVVLEINPAFQFDLKITQIYYLYDLRRPISFFNNGLLIYHKNRLITRYKYPLGELIVRKFYKHSHSHNFLRLFGFIELPDHIPVNLFKTSYLYHIMMEKLFSRLKFINKSFKRQLGKMARDPDYRRPAPTKLNEEEAQQEKHEASEPKEPKQPKERPQPRKPETEETNQRLISLRRRKTPHRQSLQQRLKALLKDPTSSNIKEIIKLIQGNSDNNTKQDTAFINRKRQLLNMPPFAISKSTGTGRVGPVSSRSCNVDLRPKDGSEDRKKNGMTEMKENSNHMLEKMEKIDNEDDEIMDKEANAMQIQRNFDILENEAAVSQDNINNPAVNLPEQMDLEDACLQQAQSNEQFNINQAVQSSG